MPDFIKRKKKISSLENLDIDTSDISIRKPDTYTRYSRKRKLVVLGDEVELGALNAPKLKERGVPGPKAYYPSQEAIQRVADVIKELKSRRMKAILDTRDEK